MTKKIEAKARVVLTDWHNEPATHQAAELTEPYAFVW